MDRNALVLFVSRFLSGQARKSLWIETGFSRCENLSAAGQARKSLWIETLLSVNKMLHISGQARKSLWIETIQSRRIRKMGPWSGS